MKEKEKEIKEKEIKEKKKEMQIRDLSMKGFWLYKNSLSMCSKFDHPDKSQQN